MTAWPARSPASSPHNRICTCIYSAGGVTWHIQTFDWCTRS